MLLLQEGNGLADMLGFMVACEKGGLGHAVFAGGPANSKKLMTFYLDALKWANIQNNSLYKAYFFKQKI